MELCDLGGGVLFVAQGSLCSLGMFKLIATTKSTGLLHGHLSMVHVVEQRRQAPVPKHCLQLDNKATFCRLL